MARRGGHLDDGRVAKRRYLDEQLNAIWHSPSRDNGLRRFNVVGEQFDVMCRNHQAGPFWNRAIAELHLDCLLGLRGYSEAGERRRRHEQARSLFVDNRRRIRRTRPS